MCGCALCLIKIEKEKKKTGKVAGEKNRPSHRAHKKPVTARHYLSTLSEDVQTANNATVCVCLLAKLADRKTEKFCKCR